MAIVWVTAGRGREFWIHVKYKVPITINAKEPIRVLFEASQISWHVYTLHN